MSTKDTQLHALVRKLVNEREQMNRRYSEVEARYKQFVEACESQPRSITEEIDSIPGRRIFYTLASQDTFAAALQGTRGNPLIMQVSQDGPFIMTHYPLVMWRPSAPNNADNFGRWSPVGSWPLPTQDQTDMDRIDISYEVQDAGPGRNFQNQALPPLLSRPDNMVPLPVPTLFAPNSNIAFIPTYERIFFPTAPEVDTTQGTIVVALPGYRIVSM